MIISNERDFNKRGKLPHFTNNITPQEQEAIRKLKENQKIIIKPVDKGSAVVILNREDYLSEGYKQLSDTNFYLKQDSDLTEKHRIEVQSFLDSLYNDGEIDTSVSVYLTDAECRTAKLYLLP